MDRDAPVGEPRASVVRELVPEGLVVRAGHHAQPGFREAAPYARHNFAPQLVEPQNIRQVAEGTDIEDLRPTGGLRLWNEAGRIHAVGHHERAAGNAALTHRQTPVFLRDSPHTVEASQPVRFEISPALILAVSVPAGPRRAARRELPVKAERDVVLHQQRRRFRRGIAEGRHVGVFDLHQVRLPASAQAGDQRTQAARLVMPHLPGKPAVFGWKFVQVHHVNLAEDLVQFVVVDGFVLFADGNESEIHFGGEFPAKVEDADSAAMRKRVRQKRRDDQHFRPAWPGSRPGRKGGFGRGAAGDGTARQIGGAGPQAPQPWLREQAKNESRFLQRVIRLPRRWPALPHAIRYPAGRRSLPEQQQPRGAGQAAARNPQCGKLLAVHQDGAGKRSQHAARFARLQSPERRHGEDARLPRPVMFLSGNRKGALIVEQR